MSIYSMENEAFASLAKYGGIAVLKMIMMSPMTGICRRMTRTFSNKEDATFVTGVKEEEALENMLTKRNTNVDRVRAAHLNDIENVVPFSLISLLYLSTEPDKDTAALLFKTFATLRILHTAVYLGKVRQPARAACFLGGFGINLFMLYKVLRNAW